jgi:hypothetical protein
MSKKRSTTPVRRSPRPPVNQPPPSVVVQPSPRLLNVGIAAYLVLAVLWGVGALVLSYFKRDPFWILLAALAAVYLAVCSCQSPPSPNKPPLQWLQNLLSKMLMGSKDRD